MGWKGALRCAAFEVVCLQPCKFKEHDFNTRLEPHTHFLPKHNSMDWHKGPEAEPRVFLNEFADLCHKAFLYIRIALLYT
jgi:hypothetical protein